MRFFWTFFWTFLLVEMLTYVVSSMTGVNFDYQAGATTSVVVTVLIFITTSIIPNEPLEKH